MINITNQLGRLGEDAKFNTFEKEGSEAPLKFITFSLAVSENVKRKGEWVEDISWIDCTYWSDNENLIPFLKKGSQILVSGNLENLSFKPSNFKEQEKITNLNFKLTIRTLKLLDSKGESFIGQEEE